MRVVAIRTLREFWLTQPPRSGAEKSLSAWVDIVEHAGWANPVDLKRTFNSADPLGDGRIVFDVGGNKFRIVALVNFLKGIVFIQFVGTHEDYDRIDARTVRHQTRQKEP